VLNTWWIVDILDTWPSPQKQLASTFYHWNCKRLKYYLTKVGPEYATPQKKCVDLSSRTGSTVKLTMPEHDPGWPYFVPNSLARSYCFSFTFGPPKGSDHTWFIIGFATICLKDLEGNMLANHVQFLSLKLEKCGGWSPASYSSPMSFLWGRSNFTQYSTGGLSGSWSNAGPRGGFQSFQNGSSTLDSPTLAYPTLPFYCLVFDFRGCVRSAVYVVPSWLHHRPSCTAWTSILHTAPRAQTSSCRRVSWAASSLGDLWSFSGLRLLEWSLL